MAEGGTLEDLNLEIRPDQLACGKAIGSGCTAEVFQGRYAGSVEEVAIKKIKINLPEKHRLAFEREVKIMAKVKHPNLVALLGVCSKTKPFQIITEFCFGGCLFELLHNHVETEINWTQQMKMIEDTAEAMAYLHNFEEPIIHRDLKSLNLLLKTPVACVQDAVQVKVSDFGISKIMQGAETDWGKMTMQAGTCHWMAPEVFESTRYDLKVDVYSFAMIMFEVLCREIPFEDIEPAKVAVHVCKLKNRPDMEALPPDAPEPLVHLMIECWEHNPDQRPVFQEIVSRIKRIEVPVYAEGTHPI